jgi:hypothetical protein
VTPVPILPLFLRLQLAKLAMLNAMRLNRPSVVITNLARIPSMVVTMVGVEHSITNGDASFTTGNYYSACESDGH